MAIVVSYAFSFQYRYITLFQSKKFYINSLCFACHIDKREIYLFIKWEVIRVIVSQTFYTSCLTF